MEFMQNNAVYIFIATLLLWMVWMRVLAPKFAGVKSISAAGYKAFRDQPHTLVDVRQPAEWQEGHAAQAIHIPLGEIARRMDEISQEKPVVLICASGARSSMAAVALSKQGFCEVYNFAGGMGAWRGAGLPVR